VPLTGASSRTRLGLTPLFSGFRTLVTILRPPPRATHPDDQQTRFDYAEGLPYEQAVKSMPGMFVAHEELAVQAMTAETEALAMDVNVTPVLLTSHEPVGAVR
jgi:hypothetical protein